MRSTEAAMAAVDDAAAAVAAVAAVAAPVDTLRDAWRDLSARMWWEPADCVEASAAWASASVRCSRTSAAASAC